MELARIYTTVETHTAGEPFRIVTGGFPALPGETILERRRWVEEHLDHVRRALIHEPRGHADMYGGLVTAPVSPSADLGVVFMHNEGYSTGCGHGVIALATAAVATGMVTVEEPETRVGIDTPSGLVEAFVAWDGRTAGPVRFLNVPSFLLHRDVEVETPGFGRLVVDVAYGGAFYAYLDGSQAGVAVEPGRYEEIVRLGDEVKRAVEAAVEVVHPEEPELRGVYGTMVAGPPRAPGADQANACVFADRQVDRSPTGTGTSGRLAQLHARGLIEVGGELVNESIIGTRFTGRVVGETRAGDLPAVITEITGRAHLTGFARWVLEPDDPVAEGFSLRTSGSGAPGRWNTA